MTIQTEIRTLIRFARSQQLSAALLIATPFAVTTPAAGAQPPFRQRLSTLPFKISYETYTNDNWEIFVMNADGSNPVNLTHSPKVHEHYPQVSPDGTKICYSVDEGDG